MWLGLSRLSYVEILMVIKVPFPPLPHTSITSSLCDRKLFDIWLCELLVVPTRALWPEMERMGTWMVGENSL